MSRLTSAGAFLLAAAALLVTGLILGPVPGGPAPVHPAGGAEVLVDPKARTVRIPAVAAVQGRYEVLKGAIEYVLVSKGGKEYETLFVTESPPEEVHRALTEAGFAGGKPAGEETPPSGARASITVEYQAQGKLVRRPVDELIVRSKTGERLTARSWIFTGSTRSIDPESRKEVLQCAVTRSVVGLHHGDPSSLLQNSRSEARDENLYRADPRALPPDDLPVTLVIAPYRKEVPPHTRRVHVFVSGRVQGVGFRAYTEGEARRLKLEGFVKNLPDGRVEAVVEGPREGVALLLQKLEKGPRAARVEKVEARDEPPTGELEEFRVEY